MHSNDVRQKFLNFYTDREHKQVPNAPLVLTDDPSTLFTSSGMQALVPYLLGKEHPLGKRLCNVQKCLRAQDLDEIGNGRHHSMFEMLGCWSLGDYFKKEQIPWTFEFFVKELNIPAEKLYVTVFSGTSEIPRDHESVEIWKETFAKYGITAEDTDDVYSVGTGNYRIFYYPKAKNWWERSPAPIGDPAGPDTEIFFFTGQEHKPEYGEKCHVNCDCGRYVEIGNNVFMQYKKVSNDSYEQMSVKNVDCGWGFERLVRVVQGKKSNYETDLFMPTIEGLEKETGEKFGVDNKKDWVFRIIADHLRASAFLIADGVFPGNKMQGYVLRRILRRAIFRSRYLNTPQGVLGKLAVSVTEQYEKPYPHVFEARNMVLEKISEEEEKFLKTLDKGLKELDKVAQKNSNQIATESVSMFYETYGIPEDLTRDICIERGYSII